MRRLRPALSPELQAFVKGYIVASDDHLDLGASMLEVSLPNGILINAGWYPDSNPNGRYKVSVSRRLRYLISPFYTPDPDEAAETVAELAAEYSQPRTRSTSNSETEYTRCRVPQLQAV